MGVYRGKIELDTEHELCVLDITPKVRNIVNASGFRNGIVNVFVQGSTAAISTIEYEDGLVTDLSHALERIAPRHIEYQHHLRWHDDNGRSHIRATVIGAELTLPFENGELLTGTWQQIVLIELDTRGRRRKVFVTVIGE